MKSTDKQAAGRRKIVLLAALAALPLIIAYALYFGGWRPATTGNYGELVQPPRPVADATYTLLDGASLRFSQLQGKWTFLIFGAAECVGACERNLSNIRRIIEAQGKEAVRVQAVFVATDAKARDWLHYTLKEYPGTRAIVGPAETVTELARQFASWTQKTPENRVYLVDPLGNLMMSYPADADPSRVRKDLSRLLRASRIG